VTILLTALMFAPLYARAIEACSVVSLAEVSAALDPTTGLTVQGTNSNPQVGACQFQTGDGSILLVNASAEAVACAKTLGILEQQSPKPTAVSGIGDRALLRSQDGTLQVVATEASRCIALTLSSRSHLAALDDQHVLAVLAVEALSRDWNLPPRQFWDEPANQQHPLADERIRAVQALLKQNPKDLKAVTAIGFLYIRLNQFESAREYLQSAIDVGPKRADLYYDLGMVEWQPAKQFVDAQRATQAGQATSNLASCITPSASLVKSAENAIDNMQKALAVEPEYFPAADYLATMYQDRAGWQCQDEAARSADLKTANEWRVKALNGAQKATSQAFLGPANAVSWQGVTPLGTPPPPSVSATHDAGSLAERVPIAAGVSQGLLIAQVPPVYPALARQARISGAVVLRAVIGTDGAVEGLQLVTGHPMLAPAAIEAVKQWKYRPYVVNGSPVEVETTINVNFVLSDK
jgi:TonB family protein